MGAALLSSHSIKEILTTYGSSSSVTITIAVAVTIPVTLVTSLIAATIAVARWASR
jgi:hypothetical protein